jgi:hypothetical protein
MVQHDPSMIWVGLGGNVTAKEPISTIHLYLWSHVHTDAEEGGHRITDWHCAKIFAHLQSWTIKEKSYRFPFVIVGIHAY